jgi:branched-chain amino acid transport system substrate-binding protein
VRVRSSIARLAAVVAILAAFGGRAVAAEPVDVYAVLPITGNNAFAGTEAREALSALQGVVNATGGIGGRPVNFVYLDSQANPETAVQLTDEIVAKHVPLVIGDSSVAGCNAMAALLKNGPVHFCLSPGFRPERGGFSYTIGLSAIDQARVIFRFLRARGWNRVALIVSTDATGRLAEPDFATVAGLPENRDVHVVTVEHFNPTDVTIAAQAARIRAAGAQAIIAWVNGSPFGTVARSLKDAALALPVVAGTGNLSYKELQTFADFVPAQLFFCWTAVPAAGQPIPRGPLSAAQSVYAQTFRNLGIKPDYGHAGAWDTGFVALSALRAVGPDATAEQVRAYVNSLHGLAGVQAVFDFRSGDMRGIPVDAARLVEWDQAKTAWFVAAGPEGAKR